MYADKLEDIYLDWVNNFISLEGYASYYGLTVAAAESLLTAAKLTYEDLTKNM